MSKRISHSIKQGENDMAEFKSSFSDEVIISLVAFTNAKGGVVYVGVEDDGSIKGLQLGKETISQWVNDIKNKTAPAIIPDAEVIEINHKKIVTLSIQEYPVKPVSFKGKYFKRIKNANRQLNVSEIAEMHAQSLQSSWDAYPNPSASVDDIDFDKVSIFINKVNSGGRFQLPANVTETLNKLKLLQRNVPANAALLLFGKDPANHNVHVGRFKTPSMIIDDKMLKGDLFSLVEETMRYIISQIKVAFEITGKTSQRTEIFEYPIPALRELVMNAIVHRDYTSPIDIQIKIFDQSISIFNPGRLFGNLTIEDLKTDHYQSNARNRLIAEAFYLTKDIEKYGSGFIRIRKEIESYPTMQYDYKEVANGFWVELSYRQQKTTVKTAKVVEKVVEKVAEKVVEKVVENLTDNQVRIIQLIEKNKFISARQIAEIIKISHRKVQENMLKLKASGIIQRIGPAKGGYWQIMEKE